MDFSATKPINAQAIKNIIFDFGGVIINIDYRLTAQAFVKLGITSFEGLFSQAAQSRLFDSIEIGAISPADFRNELRKVANLDITDEQFDNAWNAMLLDYPKHRLDFLFKNKGSLSYLPAEQHQPDTQGLLLRFPLSGTWHKRARQPF